MNIQFHKADTEKKTSNGAKVVCWYDVSLNGRKAGSISKYDGDTFYTVFLIGKNGDKFLRLMDAKQFVRETLEAKDEK